MDIVANISGERSFIIRKFLGLVLRCIMNRCEENKLTLINIFLDKNSYLRTVHYITIYIYIIFPDIKYFVNL